MGALWPEHWIGIDHARGRPLDRLNIFDPCRRQDPFSECRIFRLAASRLSSGGLNLYSELGASAEPSNGARCKIPTSSVIAGIVDTAAEPDRLCVIRIVKCGDRACGRDGSNGRLAQGRRRGKRERASTNSR